MNITTYMNYEDNNKLHKTPTIVESSVPCILKNDTEIINPVIMLSFRYDSSSPPEPAYFNYCYIPEFDRYYFVTGRTYSQQYLIINLHVDALMSHASEIDDCVVVCNRSSSRYDLFIADPDLAVREDSYVATTAFDYGFAAEGSEEYVLAVTGGYNATP